MDVEDVGRMSDGRAVLHSSYDLAADRTAESQFYEMETKVVAIALNGTRLGVDSYKLLLKAVPADGDSAAVDYTCKRYTVTSGEANPRTISSLEGWTYRFSDRPTHLDEKGQVLGVDHARFAGLVDSNGETLSPVVAYLVYNTFIDFHSFCDVFPRRSHTGRGIQDLTIVSLSRESFDAQ